MKHYIVTRNSYPRGYPGLEQRAELLRRYVVPSLRNQTCQDFTWVLTGPAGTETLDLTGIDHLVLDLPAPDDFDRTTYLMQELVSKLAADLDKGTPVVSTRLDNDDMLLPTYVEDVQARVADLGRVPLLLDAPGFRVDLRFGKVYRDTFYAPRNVPSPFISLLERKVARRCRVASAFYDQHSYMRHHFPFEHLSRPGWVQLIHGSNKVMSRPEEQVAARGDLLPVEARGFLDEVLSGGGVGPHLTAPRA